MDTARLGAPQTHLCAAESVAARVTEGSSVADRDLGAWVQPKLEESSTRGVIAPALKAYDAGLGEDGEFRERHVSTGGVRGARLLL